MTTEPATFPGYRFPAEVIRYAVWLYHLFGLSLRDVELILAERGVVASHESIRQWTIRFGADFAKRLHRRRPRPGATWHLDEVFLRINGALHYLWRAVDQRGAVLDILVQERRDAGGGQALLSPSAQWLADGAEAPRHRRSAQLRSGKARGAAWCAPCCRPTGLSEILCASGRLNDTVRPGPW
jgi:hypothetical protein